MLNFRGEGYLGGWESLDSCQMRSVKGVVGGINDGEDPRVCNMGLLNSGPNGEGGLKGKSEESKLPQKEKQKVVKIRSWCFE